MKIKLLALLLVLCFLIRNGIHSIGQYSLGHKFGSLSEGLERYNVLYMLSSVSQAHAPLWSHHHLVLLSITLIRKQACSKYHLMYPNFASICAYFTTKNSWAAHLLCSSTYPHWSDTNWLCVGSREGWISTVCTAKLLTDVTVFIVQLSGYF